MYGKLEGCAEGFAEGVTKGFAKELAESIAVQTPDANEKETSTQFKMCIEKIGVIYCPPGAP